MSIKPPDMCGDQTMKGCAANIVSFEYSVDGNIAHDPTRWATGACNWLPRQHHADVLGDLPVCVLRVI